MSDCIRGGSVCRGRDHQRHHDSSGRGILIPCVATLKACFERCCPFQTRLMGELVAARISQYYILVGQCVGALVVRHRAVVQCMRGSGSLGACRRAQMLKRVAFWVAQELRFRGACGAVDASPRLQWPQIQTAVFSFPRFPGRAWLRCGLGFWF